jgi:hypothetical protein
VGGVRGPLDRTQTGISSREPTATGHREPETVVLHRPSKGRPGEASVWCRDIEPNSVTRTRVDADRDGVPDHVILRKAVDLEPPRVERDDVGAGEPGGILAPESQTSAVSIGALGLDGDAPQPAPTPPTPSPPPGMPSGLYRTTITERDGARLGLGSEDAAGFAGTYVITLDSGRFEIHGFSQDHVIWDPITIGTYAGTGHTVRFDVTAPYGGFSWSPLRWTMAGDGLRFTMAGCRGPAARDPGLCAIERATYTAHPWVRVPD